jgi:hypothetical protein
MKYCVILMALIATTSLAQTPNPQKLSRLDELKSYALLNDTLSKLTDNLKTTLTKLSKGNASITPARYNQLLPIADNQAKLTEAKATPGEITYIKKAQEISRKESNEYTTAFQSLVDAYGNTNYKRIKDRLKTDPRLKKSYDSLVALRPAKP